MKVVEEEVLKEGEEEEVKLFELFITLEMAMLLSLFHNCSLGIYKAPITFAYLPEAIFTQHIICKNYNNYKAGFFS